MPGESYAQFAMNPDNNALTDRVAYLLKVMAHPLRLRILQLLTGGTLTATQIHTRLDKNQSSVSHQLAKLSVLGIITARQTGRCIHYSLADPVSTRLILTLLGLKPMTPAGPDGQEQGGAAS